MRKLACLVIAFAACQSPRHAYPTTGGALELSKVVLYRNGVGYFERAGHVDGDTLAIRVRKDQVNDLLKSLTVVEKQGGRAVSISMPLDPRAWANAASATLGPGNGSLAEVLDKLRGTVVTLRTFDQGSIHGRILIVEALENQARPNADANSPAQPEVDYKVTLLDGDHMEVVQLSKVAGITLHNGDVAMQFQRSLDATAGEGMFQQVDVTIRLAGRRTNDLLVSYVVSAPMWKPTYRVVLPEGGKGQALLQGWAVVDNTTGEDWRDIRLALTAGAPIAFRYDLHTPREVARADLSAVGTQKHATVSVGEAGYAQPAPPPPPPAVAASSAPAGVAMSLEEGKMGRNSAPKPAKIGGAGFGTSNGRLRKAEAQKDDEDEDESGAAMPAPEAPAMDADALARSMQANTHAAAVSGLTRYDLDERLTVPDGTSTMVAIINAKVDGEETFMFRPGGGGQGMLGSSINAVRSSSVSFGSFNRSLITAASRSPCELSPNCCAAIDSNRYSNLRAASAFGWSG